MEEETESKGSSLVDTWCKRIAASEARKEDYIEGTDRIVKAYRNDKRTERDSMTDSVHRSVFNIYWSTVQVMLPGVFSRVPKPEVRRRYLDKDPVGRVASMALERNIANQCENYDFVRVGENCVSDFLLRGMAIAWVRYVSENEVITPEAIPVSMNQMGELTLPDGQPAPFEQINEEGVIQPPDYEQLAYESVVVDYIPLEDFDCSPEPLWEDKWWISRKHSFTRAELKELFGDVGADVPLNREHDADQDISKEDQDRPLEASVHEIWDKRKRKVYWIAKYWKEKPLKVEDDELQLEDFFPVPRPAMGTTTPDKFYPVPDYAQVQDIVQTIDETAQRIYGIIPTIKVSFGYDASIPELGTIFEGDDGEGTPLLNWDKFAGQGGIKGSTDFLPLKENATVLQILSGVFDQQKNWFYEIFGVSDIMRGSTDPRETAKAQTLKSQHGSMRMSTKRREFARFLRDIIRIKGELISEHFSYDTFVLGAGVEEMQPEDQQLIEPAYQMLQQEQARDWRINIETDSTAEEDQAFERNSRNEYIQAASHIMRTTGQMAQGAPEFIPYAGELLRFGARSYKAGRELESRLDTAIDQAQVRIQKEAAQKQQEKQQGDPKQATEMAALQIKSQKNQADLQLKKEKQDADVQLRMMELQLKAATAERDLAQQQLELQTEVQLTREKQQGDVVQEAIRSESKRATDLAKLNRV